MPAAASITTVAHVIQLSVGPVFLLTGIGAMLSVLTSRLARIVDRFRTLNNTKDEERIVHEQEMTMLLSRARWIHWAISLCIEEDRDRLRHEDHDRHQDQLHHHPWNGAQEQH